MAIYPPKDSALPHSGGARISAVDPLSPADDAGFEPGCIITSVDGHPLRDLIDWRWFSSEDVVCVGYQDLDGETGEVELEREEGESWGFAFDGVVFDGVKQCRNACTFCFMRQLPSGLRASLSVRDDDYRLSFLSGTFVTLTNLTPEDERRILEQRISPLRVSLHASDEHVRKALIGKHAQAGIEALERLLDAGVEVHAQIVLVPGVNDGEALRQTLRWAWERPGILDVGIVPLGYTRHQALFSESFGTADAASAVLEAIAPFQRRARDQRGSVWVFASDEFYRTAYGADVLDCLPPAADYGDFSMFEDGIGILRSCADNWRDAQRGGIAHACAEALQDAGVHAYYVCGCALCESFPALLEASPLSGAFEPLFVENEFFGGNVDVTGLLTGTDVARAISDTVARLSLSEPGACHDKEEGRFDGICGGAPNACSPLFFLPDVMFNDDGLTLDGWSLEDVRSAAKCPVSVVSCNPSEYLSEIASFAKDAASF